MTLFFVSVAVIGFTMFILGAGAERGDGPEAGASKRVSGAGHTIARLSDEEIGTLAASLSAEERRVLLDKGTEAAFCGTLLDNKLEGTYACRLCGLPLFASDSKFTSGTGWPSFYKPVDEDHVTTIRDTSLGMVRDEIVCTRCSGHLGHVFADGPEPTGLRYCLNSESLEFFGAAEELPKRSRPDETETAYFAGGCFWGVEDRFQQVEGVLDAVSGYQGGRMDKPTYRQVCSGESGHAESVRVIYDPAVVTYDQLLDRFFRFHDPTQLNRQGPDVGTQYRSAIYAVDDKQLEAARMFVAAQQASERFRGRDVVTEVVSADYFYEAEAYHQDYHERHGGSCAIPAE